MYKFFLFTRVAFVRVPSIMNDYRSSQVGATIVYSATYCTIVHGDGECV